LARGGFFSALLSRAGGAEGGEETVLHGGRRRVVRRRQAGGQGCRRAELVDVGDAVGADGEVLLDGRPGVVVEGTLHPLRDDLHHLEAADRFLDHGATADVSAEPRYSSRRARTFDRARWSSTRWLASVRPRTSQASCAVKPRTSRRVITARCISGSMAMAASTTARVSADSSRSSGTPSHDAGGADQ